MTIGEVARTARVSVDAIRFYERRGILPPPMRRASGYRTYTAATVERIRFVKELQQLGFALGEIRRLLRDVDTGVATCARETPRFASVLRRLDEQLAVLRAARRKLAGTLARCSRGGCALAERPAGVRRSRVTRVSRAR